MPEDPVLVIEVPIDQEALKLVHNRETVELDIVAHGGSLYGYSGKIVEIRKPVNEP